MIYQQKGVMIRQASYSESSRIITVLTEDGSQVPLMSRGFNKPKSPFIVLRQGIKEALFTYNRFKGIGTLNEVDVIQPFKKVNGDFTVYTYGSYIMELITRALEEDMKQDSFYRLLIRSLGLLEAESEPAGVTAFTAIKMLPYYGGQINVDECAVCKARDRSLFTHYSFSHHSVICSRCADEETVRRAVPVSNRVLYLAGYMKHVPIDNVESVNISKENGRLLLSFIEMIYDEYTGVYFKSRRLIKSMEDAGQ
ncbi:DNA repair protein RecO [Salinicoccus sp. ID82-1]|uniref:DNA repair protein RecO n=1 Tax=Salinicoccus sp. ID82-1 TaxID=2820269 RepID=UPI001F025340|nr:DNA repair protein RecO [Salinicoccus sp. ID82-1]MCG1008981.1 DNA repair protein RecO [Salinicoccus sp. ID82-1]